jgi:acetamidase/formamidase
VIHELPLERRTLHGHFSRDLEPVLTVDPGDRIVLSTLESGWHLEPGRYFEPRDPALDSGHALCGPIEVRGARAGATLAIRIEAVEVGPWGATVVFGNPGLGVEWRQEPHVRLWELEGTVGRSGDVALELAPFLGVIGMPPPEPGIHSTIPPRRYGGNLDCKELVAGSTLYLPVPVDGALLSLGDGHARQADGEVCGTAIECPLARVEVTVALSELELTGPVAQTPAGWVTLGLGPSLDEAARAATAAMLDLLEREHGLERADALALASLVVDLRVTQVVNDTVGVHAVLAYPPPP